MFRSRKTRRPKRGARRRRLGVESMEARLMLSTTSYYYLPPQEFDGSHFIAPGNKLISIDAAQYAQSMPIANLTEGGFIAVRPDVSAGDSNADQFVLNRAAFESFESFIGTSVTRASGGILAITPTWGQLFGSAASEGTGIATPRMALDKGWSILNSTFDSSGLQPAAIPSALDDGDLNVNMSPVVVAPPGSPGGPSEGGSIPIHAILADLRRDSGLASNNGRSVSSATIEKSIEAAAVGHRVTMSEGAMAGEWARGMVFEIAGGEPGTIEPNLLRQRRDSDSDSLQPNEPLSSVEVPNQDGKLAHRREAAAQPNGATHANESGEQPATPANGQAAAIVAPLLPSDAAKIVEDAQLAANPSDKESPELTAAAAAAVFDQLGKSNMAVIESAVDGKSWLRSVGSSPLLMVLALERIAALNSRRSNRDSRVAAAKKQRRLLS